LILPKLRVPNLPRELDVPAAYTPAVAGERACHLWLRRRA
jgi:hypothetical protein